VDVQDEVKKRIISLGKNGGLILAPAHRVQADTPMENFWAMVEFIQKSDYQSLFS
jgi:uroporphyrinogen-III decarboxylase